MHFGIIILHWKKNPDLLSIASFFDYVSVNRNFLGSNIPGLSENVYKRKLVSRCETSKVKLKRNYERNTETSDPSQQLSWFYSGEFYEFQSGKPFLRTPLTAASALFQSSNN